MFDLVFSLVDENARAYHEELTELPGPHLERWILVTRDNGVAWIVRRRLIGAQAITCVARGYQEIEHWPLTNYAGRARGGVAIETTTDAVRLIIRSEVVDLLRAQPWAKGHIHQFDWRLTIGRTHWTAEARCNGGDPAWMKLAMAE